MKQAINMADSEQAKETINYSIEISDSSNKLNDSRQHFSLESKTFYIHLILNGRFYKFLN